MILARALQGIDTDNGPHSMTRVQFRVRLLRAAKNPIPAKRDEALAILTFMREKGVLMALRNEPGELGELARRAYFEVMNPKASTESLPAAPAGAQAASGSPLPR